MTTTNIGSNYLQFLNSGTNYGRITGTSDGLLTLSSNAGNVRIAGTADPTGLQDVATKNYVDTESAPGGSITQLQYNNAGTFGGMVNFSYDLADLNVTGASIVNIIDPPVSGTDVVNKTYADSLAASPGGSTTQVQYNNAGSFAGSTALTVQDATTIVLNNTLISPDGSSSAGTDLNITAGSGNGTNQNGGSVVISGGSATGTGTDGIVQFGSLMKSNVQYGFTTSINGNATYSDGDTILNFTYPGAFRFDRSASFFDTATGIYTAPKDGLYVFNATIFMTQITVRGVSGVYFSHNDGPPEEGIYIHFRELAVNELIIVSGTILMNLTSGDTIRLKCRVTNVSGDPPPLGQLSLATSRNYFSGYLLC